MELGRKPFQGVVNIVRFNWHFYAGAFILFFLLLLTKSYFPQFIQQFITLGIVVAIISIIISLAISCYIYDLSDLYKLHWLRETKGDKILNISAGFDETSEIIRRIFPASTLTVCDFYNPQKHTEFSIKMARKAYPVHAETIQVDTRKLPFGDDTFDISIAILSAHEIRNIKERVIFFNELKRITKSSGAIKVTEHLRDLNNFFAYTIGFFHFHSRRSWFQTFEDANLIVKKEIKTTPFITTFVLIKNGNTS